MITHSTAPPVAGRQYYGSAVSTRRPLWTRGGQRGGFGSTQAPGTGEEGRFLLGCASPRTSAGPAPALRPGAAGCPGASSSCQTTPPAS